MRIYIILCAAALFFLFGSIHAQPDGYQLMWSDEFNYTGAPDNSKWGYDLGGGGWGNNELEYYTSRLENASVQDGKLRINTIKESYGGYAYTSARLITKYKGDWLYGRFEINARLPEGRGIWAAIWMLPTDWAYGGWPNSGEIDIMEFVGFDPGTVFGTIHTEAYHGADGRGTYLNIADVSEAFHTYAIEWDEDSIKIFTDNQMYYAYPDYGTGSDRWPFDKRFHLLLNIAVGGNWGGAQGVDTSIFPQNMEIDYVRVYQKFAQRTIIGPSQIYANQENIIYELAGFQGATYEWTFPEGVVVVSGQGTNRVSVNWGENPGLISVLQSFEGNSFTSTKSVDIISTPGDSSLIIRGNENVTGSWQINAGEGNAIEMTYEE
jgi:beta-glucanase (GH16 family)